MSLLTELHKRLTARGESVAAAKETAGRRGARTERALAARKQAAGFTLTEALATLIIVGLVTTILASGIGLATNQYTKSMSNSEAQILYSSLQKILDTELRFTKTILVESDQDRMAVKGFFSKHYVPNSGGAVNQTGTSMLCTVTSGTGSTGAHDPRTPGQLGMASKIDSGAEVSTFLGEGAYNYGLQACLNSLTYVKSGRYFVVDLAITKNSDVGNPLAQGVFTVHAYNLTAATDESGNEINIKRDPDNSGNNSGSNTGEGEGGGDEGSSSDDPVTSNGGFKVPNDLTSQFEAPVKQWGSIEEGAAKAGNIILSENGSVYYVANSDIPPGTKDPIIDGTGNSSQLITVKMDRSTNPPVPLVVHAEDLVKNQEIERGTLCISNGKLYIATKTNKTTPGNDGNWQEVLPATLVSISSPSSP